MSFTSEYFTINGTRSVDIGVNGCYLIRTDSEISRSLMGSKNIISEKIRYKDIPYFYTVEKQPIEFDLKISLLDKEFDEDTLFNLGDIFAQDHYVEFRSADFIGKVFYVICTEMQLITYGSFKGWINIHMINCAPFCFSDKFIRNIDLTDEILPYTFTIDAKFNVQHPKYGNYYFPELEFDLLDNSTSFILTNMSDGCRTISFSGLQQLENINIKNDLKQIESNLGLLRISNFNKNWFRLTKGQNILKVDQRCKLQIRGQYPVYL